MPRAKIEAGAWGEITFTILQDGRIEGVARYRRQAGGPLLKAKLRAGSKASVTRALIKKLAILVETVDTGASIPTDAALVTAVPERMTFAQLADLFIEEGELYEINRMASRHEEARLVRSLLIPKLGSALASQIRSRDIDRVYKEIFVRTKPQARNALTVLRKIF